MITLQLTEAQAKRLRFLLWSELDTLTRQMSEGDPEENHLATFTLTEQMYDQLTRELPDDSE